MTFEEFVARFRRADEMTRACGPTAAGEPSFVAVAGRVLSTSAEECLIDVNGAQYEVSPMDISEIQLLPTAPAPTDDGGEIASTDVVLLKINGNAFVCRRVPMRVGLVSAAGTWVSVVATPPEDVPEQGAEAG